MKKVANGIQRRRSTNRNGNRYSGIGRHSSSIVRFDRKIDSEAWSYLPVALRLVVEDFILFSGKITTVTRFKQSLKAIKRYHKLKLTMRVLTNLDGAFFQTNRINDKYKKVIFRIKKRACKNKVEVFYIDVEIPIDWAENPKAFLKTYEFL